jgi:hypothetical protein
LLFLSFEMVKILNKESLLELPNFDEKEFELISSDSIDEEKIKAKIISSGVADVYCAVAVQLAIVGYGGKDFSEFKYKGRTNKVKDFFDSQGVLYNLTLQEKIQPDDLTPRRLIRIFRHHIMRFLELNTEVSSYLHKKYSDGSNESRKCVFAGAEHVVGSAYQAELVKNAYQALDEAQGTNISTRINRILQARKPEIH